MPAGVRRPPDPHVAPVVPSAVELGGFVVPRVVRPAHLVDVRGVRLRIRDPELVLASAAQLDAVVSTPRRVVLEQLSTEGLNELPLVEAFIPLVRLGCGAVAPGASHGKLHAVVDVVQMHNGAVYHTVAVMSISVEQVEYHQHCADRDACETNHPLKREFSLFVGFVLFLSD